MRFVGEEVKVLIEKRKVSRVHVRYKTLNLVMLCSCFADCMTFSNVIQFFLCFWYCARAPAPTPGVDMWWLVLVVDSKNLPGIAPTTLPCTPKGLRVLSCNITKKWLALCWPLYYLYVAAKCIEKRASSQGNWVLRDHLLATTTRHVSRFIAFVCPFFSGEGVGLAVLLYERSWLGLTEYQASKESAFHLRTLQNNNYYKSPV